MRTEHIECFLALAETLNYTEAAYRLYTTQSTLSRTIFQMEEELGVTLFCRSRRGVTLTPAGQSFYEDSKGVLDDYNRCVARAKNAYKGERGKIRFGAHSNLVEPIALDIISGFSKSKPEIAWDISGMPTSRMIYALDEGDVDCIISPGIPHKASIERMFLKQYRECVVMGRSHPLAACGVLSMEMLRNEHFVVMSRDFSNRGYDSVISKAHAAGYNPTIVAKASSVPHLMTILASGEYITILSENYRNMALDRLSFVPLDGQYMTDFYFMWDTESLNPCVKHLADYVRSEFMRPYPGGPG